MDRYIPRNTERLARLRAELALVSRRLESEHIEFLLLKGFSLGPEYTLDPRLRMHYDFDLFVPEQSAEAAYRAVVSLGYEPLSSNDQTPKDHLPTLTRKTGWQWRDDPFDPEIPPTVELHFRFWDPEAECLPVSPSRRTMILRIALVLAPPAGRGPLAAVCFWFLCWLKLHETTSAHTVRGPWSRRLIPSFTFTRA
jgi:hypothetical protein